MQSPELFAALTNRSILDQRFATSLNNETLELLKELSRYLRDRINREGTRIATQKRLETLLADVNKKTEQIYSDIETLYFKQFKELSVEEADFVVAAMQSVVVSDVVIESVSNQRLWAAITKNPLNLGGDNGYVDFNDMIKNLGGNSRKVASMISGGYSQGLTNQEIVQGLIGTRANNYQDGIVDKSRRDASSIVRTAINSIANTSRDEIYQQNSDIIYGYRIVATIDTRTSVICRGYDQKVVRYTDKFQPKPPFHYNCVLEGTIVSTCSGVDKLFKRAYKGTVIDIVTKSGRKLSITPNHPVLTRNGWKAAKLIDGSDQLATIPEKVFIGEHYKDSVKSEISDLFSSIDVLRKPSLIANRPSTTKDFHGDGSNSEISVIDIDRLTWNGIKSIFNKKSINNWFGTRKLAHSTLHSLGSLSERLLSWNPSCGGDIGSLGVCTSFFKSHLAHALGLLLRPISKLAKLAYKKLFYGSFTAIKADMLGDAANTDTTFISFDDVVLFSSRKVNGSCHVYNLENKDNWYLSNGIITHNCRTSTVPEIYGNQLKDTGATRAVNFKKRGDVEAGKVGQVSSQQQYYEILKRQPAAQQDLVLGKARGLIFRNSGLSADEFRKAMTDTMGNPLTLKDMARENKRILDYMQNNSFLSEYIDSGS